MLSYARKTLVIVAALFGPVVLAQPAGATVSPATTTTWKGTSSNIAFGDTTTGTSVTCTSGTLAGQATTGGLGGGLTLNTATSMTNNSCTQSTLTYTVTMINNWAFSSTATSGSTSVGTVSLSVKLSASGCSFNLTGSTSFSFNTSTNTLSFAPVSGSGAVLTIGNVSGCFGVVANGHTGKYVATYHVTSP